MSKAVDLSSFNGMSFDKGAGIVKITLWYFVNALFVRASWNPFMSVKIFLLKVFGARIGRGLIIKNNVIVKYPWKLTVGDNCWLGEGCWIDNLDYVNIGNNVCVSQGVMLLTGNHDYKVYSMPYRNAPIVLEDGSWIGARAVVCPGVTVHGNSVLSVGSVAAHDMEEGMIYQGVPAVPVRARGEII